MILYRLERQRFVRADAAVLTKQLSRLNVLCGSGGKTSLLFYLGRELAQRGESTLLTTTTHLCWDENAVHSVEAALSRLAAGESPILAALPFSEQKLKGFSAAEQTRLYAAFDRSLVEADGSRGLPLKIPRTDEPALPAEIAPAKLADFNGDTVSEGNAGFSEKREPFEKAAAFFLMLGLGALGQRAGDVVHRLAELGPLLYPALTADTKITPSHIAEILKRGYFRKAAFRALPLTLLLNQADTPAHLQGAEVLAALLVRENLLCEEQILALSFPPFERHPR